MDRTQLILIAAAILLAIGALALFRGRALLHWKRGFRNLSSWQRTWLIRGEDVRTLRFYGAVFLSLGFIALAAAIQSDAGLQTALNLPRP
jgi:hypothetical protein